MKAIGHSNKPVKLQGGALHEVWWRGRQWAVTSYGIEALDGTYPIERTRFTEEHRSGYPYSWIAHMADKSWIDLEDLATALFVGCAMHGYQLIKADVALLRKHFSKGKGQAGGPEGAYAIL